LKIPFPDLGRSETLRTTSRRHPKAKQQLPHWQAAIEALIMAAENRGLIGLTLSDDGHWRDLIRQRFTTLSIQVIALKQRRRTSIQSRVVELVEDVVDEHLRGPVLVVSREGIEAPEARQTSARAL
jgi:hypothetical protein